MYFEIWKEVWQREVQQHSGLEVGSSVSGVGLTWWSSARWVWRRSAGARGWAPWAGRRPWRACASARTPWSTWCGSAGSRGTCAAGRSCCRAPRSTCAAGTTLRTHPRHFILSSVHLVPEFGQNWMVLSFLFISKSDLGLQTKTKFKDLTVFLSSKFYIIFIIKFLAVHFWTHTSSDLLS